MREEIQGIAYALFKTTNAAKIPITKNHFKLRDRILDYVRHNLVHLKDHMQFPLQGHGLK
jgi:hypothetical protein